MGKRYKILVVDDDPIILELIEGMLIPAGYYVTTLSDSTRIIDTMKNAQPDLILLDIMMPVEDGFTILNKLKRGMNRSNIPVVMVTAIMDDDHKGTAGKGGASAYITKPIDRTLLLDTIARLLPDSESSG